ncbi:MAG: DUF4177 domain-containing protein [Pararhodobacter sp.]|nr:DUF4177 domain-containing protein [Pararhodobacter sp.]
MEDYEYKVIPAPARAIKVKGLKTTAERFAYVLTEALNREAEQGWEFVRSESLPCEERKGLMSTTRSTQTVLVFRRALYAPDDTDDDETPFSLASGAQGAAEPALHGAGSAHPVPAFRAEPRLGQAGQAADDAAAARREPALRAVRPEEDR